MEEINFPGIQSHKLVHKEFLTRVADFQKQFKITGVLDTQLFDFLKFWFNAHTGGVDKKYGEFGRDG